MKRQIRQEVRQRLAQLDAMTRYARSLAACKRLSREPEFVKAETVMVFLSLPDEVETAMIALACWQKAKTVVAPKVFWEHGRMLPVEINSLETGLTTTQHGMFEPVASTPVPLEMLDLVLVPGLAFDRTGNRLGRGKGFYDRFLSQNGLRAVTCGVAFEEQLYDKLPAHSHDHPVDMLVTDEETLRFTPHRNEDPAT